MKRKLLKLRKYRREKGFTREQLAKELKISKFTFRSYEQGDRQIKAETLKKISIILECTTDDLI